MSDIASQLKVAPATSQLPVSWYFDDRIFELEKRLIFDAGPGYVGHRLMVPEVHDYRSLEWRDHASLLVHGDDGFHEMSNVCRHRQAIMLEGSGRLSNIVCPLHRWTYDRRGQLLGAHLEAEKAHHAAVDRALAAIGQGAAPVTMPRTRPPSASTTVLTGNRPMSRTPTIQRETEAGASALSHRQLTINRQTDSMSYMTVIA